METDKEEEQIHAYPKFTMEKEDQQTEHNKTRKYPKFSMEEYNVEEWTNQSLHLTNEEENTLLMAFINENIEDQETWINAKTNVARNLAIKETKKREGSTLNNIDKIIPTEIPNSGFERSF
jgi:hypothetical protein